MSIFLRPAPISLMLITKKSNTYGQAALQNSAALVPLAFTSFGAYHGHFQKFLNRVARIAVATLAIDPCKEKHFVSY